MLNFQEDGHRWVWKTRGFLALVHHMPKHGQDEKSWYWLGKLPYPPRVPVTSMLTVTIYTGAYHDAMIHTVFAI